ncbi:hypothetical protein Tco_0938011 [Tanacetum coccineum]|uniref:Uncharacterized protein n=1 Tax=Tanacetum coccineum TaxID=301880 RepID=A0ABQ5DIN9_9ASTR
MTLVVTAKTLLLFDDLVFKLSGEQCVHLIRQHGENYDDYFPDKLNVLVGKRLLFRFHYTDDHINNNNHVYQVKMLSQDEAMITMFKKDFIIEEPEVDLQTPVPSHANSSRFTNVDSIPFKLDETPKSSYVATKGNASHGDREHNSMEIESDAGGSGSGKRIFIDLDDYDEDEEQEKRMKKLSGEQCVHLIRQHGENYDDYFPEELNVLVGKRLLFRFHYTDDHINNNNHVYQVKMLSQDEAMITMFKKDFILEEPEVDLQTPVPSNANSSRFTNVDSIPFKLDETPKSSYVATKGNASHVDGEHSSMEIESDAGGSG